MTSRDDDPESKPNAPSRAALRRPAVASRSRLPPKSVEGAELTYAEDLTDAQVDELAEVLEALRTELRLSFSQSAEGAKAVDLEAPIGRLSRIDAIQQQKMVQAQRSRMVSRLEQVRAALAKVADDGYGECNRCEEPIGYKRLKSKPESPLCLACQSSLERR